MLHEPLLALNVCSSHLELLHGPLQSQAPEITPPQKSRTKSIRSPKNDCLNCRFALESHLGFIICIVVLEAPPAQGSWALNLQALSHLRKAHSRRRVWCVIDFLRTITLANQHDVTGSESGPIHHCFLGNYKLGIGLHLLELQLSTEKILLIVD